MLELVLRHMAVRRPASESSSDVFPLLGGLGTRLTFGCALGLERASSRFVGTCACTSDAELRRLLSVTACVASTAGDPEDLKAC